jgi:AcrR family transcriptional regulator
LTIIGHSTNNGCVPRPSQQIDQALLDAGRELLPRLGCGGVSVRALAEHAGVAPGMFHYHFGSKEHFLRTLLDGWYQQMYDPLSREAALAGPPVERLRASLMLLARFVRAHRPLLTRLWADAVDGHTVARDFFGRSAPRHVGVLLTLLGEGQAQGVLRTLPPLTALSFLMGAVALPTIFVAGLVEAGFTPSGGAAAFEQQVMSDAAIDTRIELALAALAAPAAPRGQRPRRAAT